MTQRYNLRVVDADYVQDQQALIDELKMIIRMVYWNNDFTCKQYQIAGRKLVSLNPAEALEFASKGLGLLKANDVILQEFVKYGLRDILDTLQIHNPSEMEKISTECLDMMKGEKA